MSSFLGLDIVVPVCVGSAFCWGRVLPGLDEGVVDGLAFRVLGEPSCLGVFERESSVPVRRAYGSAVAGRANSGHRGFMAGRIGADDRDEMWDPVGTVRTAVLVGLEADSDVVFTSENADCADSGRVGTGFLGLRRALF